MRSLLSIRQNFFKEYPHYGNIFFNTVLQPPKHLLKEIREIRRDYDVFTAKKYKILFQKIELRDGISEDMAYEYFVIFQEMFNGYFQNKIYENVNFKALVIDHETQLSNILNIVLYGIAKQKNT